MIPYRLSTIKLQLLLRACIYAVLLCAFTGGVADTRAQSKDGEDGVCAALDMSTEDCAQITDVSTTLPSGVILPQGGCCRPVATAVPWLVSPVRTAGANSLRSGNVSDSQGSCLVLAISLPADTLARFSLRTSSQGQHDRLAFFVDDQTVISNFSAPGGSEIRDWEQLEFMLASNVSNLSWCYIKNASASTEDDSGWLDNLTLTPTADIPLNRELVCQVLDMSADDCALITDVSSDPADLPWYISSFSSQGTDSLRSSNMIDHDQTSCLSVAASLPANTRIRFSLRSDSEPVNDYLYFAADGNRLVDRYTAPPSDTNFFRDWEQQELDIQNSVSNLRWCYTKNGDTSEGDDSGWLDALSFSLTRELICRALDMSTDDCALITAFSTTLPSGLILPTRNGTPMATDVPWFASPIARQGDNSLRSGDIDDDQASCLVLAVTLPANTLIGFSLRTSSEDFFDRLAFFADNQSLIEGFSASGDTVRDWEQQEFITSNSVSNLTWCYLKDGSTRGGADSGWLDLLSFGDSADFAATPLTQERVCRVLDMSPDDCALIRSVASDPLFPPWFVSEETAVTGSAALRSGNIADNQRSCLILNVSIPASNLIRFSLRADSEGQFDHLYFAADNRRLIDTFSAAEGSRFRNWEQLEFVSAESIDTLTWCYVKNPAVSLGGDNMRLDDLTIEDYKANICATLDMSPANCARITSVAADPPDRPWEITPLALQGGGSLRSADIDDDQQSCLILELSLPANSRISFALRTSSEAVNDFLYFEADGTRLIETFTAAGGSNLKDWEQLELFVLSDISNLKWCYTKNGSISTGDDSGWLDTLSFNDFASLEDIPLSREGVCRVLDMSIAECAQITRVSSEPAESQWFISFVATVGGSSLRSGAINDGQESCLIFNVSLPGQTVIQFSRRISSQPGADMLYFAADGQRLDFSLRSAANTVLRDWRREAYILPAGNTTLSWCYSKDGDTSEGDDSAWLDDLSLTAPSDAQFSRELVCLVLDMSAEDCVRITGVAAAPPDLPWSVSDTANQGGTALRSNPATDDNQTSCLVLEVSLPANSLINFSLRSESEAVNDFLYFEADGIRLIDAFAAAEGSSLRDWEQQELFVLSDISTLVWCYSKNDRISRGDDGGWLDTLSLGNFASLADIPLSRESVCQALDMTAAECTQITAVASEPAESPWFVSAVATEGGSSLRSGDIDDNQESCLILNMSLPGQTVVQFSRRISSQPGVDMLYFAADDQRLNLNLQPAANTVLRDWRRELYILSAGDTTLSWCYSKDGDGSEGDDSAWIDDLSLTAPPDVPLTRELVCLVLDMSADDCARITRVAAYPPDLPWSVSDPANQGGTALRSNPATDDLQTSCLVLEVSLPANSQLRFSLRSNSEGLADFLYFEVDEVRRIENFSAPIFDLRRDWEPQELFILSGTRNLRWCYSKNILFSEGDDSGWLDTLSFNDFANLTAIPLSGDVICQVLDMTAADCALITDVASEPTGTPWLVSPVATVGGTSLRSGDIDDDQQSCLIFAVSLPERTLIEFSLRTDSEAVNDFLYFEVDGVRLIDRFAAGSGVALKDWEPQEFLIASSVSTLSWCYSKNGSTSAGDDSGWLDALTFTPPAERPLTPTRVCQALDMSADDCALITGVSNMLPPGLILPNFLNQDVAQLASGSWFTSPIFSQGDSSLRSGVVNRGEASCLVLSAALPANSQIRFSLRVTGFFNNESVIFFADNQRLLGSFSVSGFSLLRDWEQRELFLSDNIGNLTWCFFGPVILSTRFAGWLDALSFTIPEDHLPLTRERICQTLDMSDDECAQISGFGSDPAETPWSVSSTATEGDSALGSADTDDDRQSCLLLDVSLPTRTVVAFSRRVSSQPMADMLYFLSDTQRLEYSPRPVANTILRDWSRELYILPTGNPTLSWCYTKDGDTSEGEDSAWIDDLSFTPLAATPLTRELLCLVLDMSDDECTQITSIASEPAESPWFIASTATEGSSSLRSGDIDDDLQSCLLFSVSLSTRTVVAFSRRVSSQPVADMLYFAADDQRLEYSPRPVATTILRDWSREPYILPAGNSSISWCYTKDGDISQGEDSAWIDDLSFTSLAATPLTRELLCQVLDMNADDCAKITSVSSAPEAQPWSVSTTATAGGSSFRSGDIGDNQQSCLVLALALPANTVITVAVRTSSAGPADHLRVFADLQLIDTLSADAGSSERDWALQTYYLPDDISALSWCYVKDSTNTAGSDSAWIDSLSFATSDIPYQNRICDALDLTDSGCAIIRSIATDRDYLWSITEETATQGGSSLRSRGTFNNIFGGDRNCFGISLRQPLPGPTRIHYSRRISAEPNRTRLVLGINGVLSEIDGFTAESTVLREWEQGQFVIPDNVISLDWCYIKDGTDAVAADSIWIDALSFVTAEVRPLCDTLDLPQSLCAMIRSVSYDPPQQLWLTTTTAFIGGDSALVSPPLAAGQTACLTLDIDNTLPSGSYLAFGWRATGTANMDILEFQAGDQQSQISNMPQWQIETVLLDGSESTLRWCYSFNSAADGQTNRGWLDSLLPIPAADRYATQLAVTSLPKLLSSTSNSFRFQVTATAVSPMLSPPEDWVLIVSGIDNIASADASHALVFSNSLAQVEVIATSANPLLPASIRLALDDQSLLPGVTVTSLTYMLPPLRQLDMLNIMAPDSVTQTDPGVAIDIAVDVAAIDNFGNLFNPTGLVLTVDTAEGARVPQSTFALTFSEGSAQTNISAELSRTGSAGSIEVSVSSGETRANASIILNPAPVRLAMLAIVVPDAVVQSELDAMFEIAVTVTATDNYGNPFEPAGLALTVTDLGNARVPQSTYALSFTAGTAQITITVGLTTGGIAGNIELSVGSGDTLSMTSITLGPVPRVLISVSLSAADSTLQQTVANTAVAAELILTALDNYGDPIEAGNISLQLSASEGAMVQSPLIVAIEASGVAQQMVEILPNDRDTVVTVQLLRGTLDESVQLLPDGGIQIAVRALRVLRQLQLSLADQVSPLRQIDSSLSIRAGIRLIGLDQYGQLSTLPTVLLTATAEPMTTVVTLDPQQLSTTVPEEAETVLEVVFPDDSPKDTTITIAIADPGAGVTVNELVVRALPDRRPPLRPLHVDDTDTGVTELDLIVALRWLADQQSSTQSRVVNLTITDTDVTADGIDNLRQLFTDPANLDRIDLNGDGRADQLDLRILLRYISGLRGTELAEQGISENAIRLIRLLLDQP